MKHLYSLVIVLVTLTSLNLSSAQLLTPTNASGPGVCDGSATFTDSATYSACTWTWYQDSTVLATNVQTVSNLCAGDYSFVIDSAGVSMTVIFTITDPCSNIALSASATACTPGNCDGTIQTTVTGGYGPYTFSVAGPQTGQSLFSDLCPGTYTVTVADMMGCVAMATATVTDPSLQTPIAANLISADDSTGTCTGSASVLPSGGTAPYNTIMWSNGAVGNSVYNLCAGNYSVAIWDANGDSAVFYFTINSPCSNIALTASITNSTPGNCDGAIQAVATGGNAPYTFSVAGAPQSPVSFFSNLCPGTYSIICTDAVGCSTAPLTVVVADTSSTSVSFWVNLSTSDDFSGNCDGAASITPTGGIAPYTVWWSNGQGGGSISNLCAGIYSVTIWDSGTDSTTIDFIIADSSTTYGNNPFPNVTINDTLYTDLVTNCIIDYSVIDSASLYQAVYDPINQNLYVTWAVYSPTDTVYISDTLGLAGLPPGYYGLTISVYCPNKSGNDFFKIESAIYFDGSNVWMSTLGVNEHLLEHVSVYPNPFNTSISVDNKDGLIQSMKLVDLNGRVLSEMPSVNSGMVKMDQLEMLSSGTYLLILSGENSSKTYKVIK